MPRFVGILLLALGIIASQMIYARAEAIYPGTLLARVVILLGLVDLYAETRDPFFVVVLGVVGLGFVLTLSAYLSDLSGR